MRTLVEEDGSIATSIVANNRQGVAVNRKATFMVKELKRFKMNIVGISETRWFGEAVYDIEGYTILHSGKSIPGVGQLAHRNEGVGIVLDSCMTTAWKNAGQVWKAVSSRIISARLKLDGYIVSGTHRQISSSPKFMSVISVYAPTFRANQDIKDRFYADLQSTIDDVHQDDLLMVVGDFSARVGSSNKYSFDLLWEGVQGYNGVGKMNECGEALLSFCALNELTIMNTMFEKKNIHKFTWQHPGSKKWHCIDYIIMRQKSLL